MKRSTFHLNHISMIESLLSGLRLAGVSLDDITRGCEIRKFNLDQSSTYIPVPLLYEFLECVKKKQGIENLASEFYFNFQINQLSDFGQYIARCENLKTVITEGIKLNHQVQSNGRIRFGIHGPVSFLYMKHVDSLPMEGRRISEEISFIMMIRAVQNVMGLQWQPLSVLLTSDSAYWLEKFWQSPTFKVFTNRKVTGFIFKTSDLLKRNPWHDVEAEPAPFPLTISSQIKAVMESVKPGIMPSMTFVSDIFGVSSKTLNRHLAAEGISFSSLLESYLQNEALCLLTNSTYSIREIGEKLGYANAPNFVRAFKKWTNTTPAGFRIQETYIS